MRNKYMYIIVILLVLFLVSFLASKVVNITLKDKSDKVAVIPIMGAITVDGSSISPLAQNTLSSTKVLDNIEKASKDKTVKAVILEINSPGGTVVASREIANAVHKLEKPSVSWIREVGASGAYWIAANSDAIVADPLSITGSIGVAGSYLEFSQLMEDYGVSYEQLNAGEYKDLGSPFRRLSNEERKILQEKLTMIHNVFLEEVSQKRKLSEDSINKIKTGLFFLGKEARDLGLVDELGSKDEAFKRAKELAGIKEAKLVRYYKKPGLSDFLDRLVSQAFYALGSGISPEINDKLVIRT